MKALVVCPTYGRLSYIGDLLASFLSQTYQDKHLVIVNDDKNIILECDYDNVSIINLNKKISVGEKRNLGASYGHFDVIHPWDDDDIFLPNRLENHMKQYEDENIQAYRNFSSYMIYADRFIVSDGGLNDISYRKKMFFDIGGYNSTENFGEDSELYVKLKNFKEEYNDNCRDFIYRFSTSNYHLSNKPEEDVLLKISEDEILDLNIKNGRFKIEPDYIEYSKYVFLDDLYRKTKSETDVGILPFGKIDITHLN